MYVQRDAEAPSRNHCCRGKAISITYSGCVSVALIESFEGLDILHKGNVTCLFGVRTVNSPVRNLLTTPNVYVCRPAFRSTCLLKQCSEKLMSKFRVLLLAVKGSVHGWWWIPTFLKNVLPPSAGQLNNVVICKVTGCRMCFYTLIFRALWMKSRKNVLIGFAMGRSACPHVTIVTAIGSLLLPGTSCVRGRREMEGTRTPCLPHGQSAASRHTGNIV
jgi:hypothetical protein